MLRFIPTALALSVFALLVPGGCGSKEPVVSPSEELQFAEGTFILYRMNGDRYPGEPVPEGSELLHGWEILQSCELQSNRNRAMVFKAFQQGQEEMTASEVTPLDCFQPRHGIRKIVDGETTDYLICFQCRNYMVWTNEQQTGGGATSDSPRVTLDEILEDCLSGG